MFSNGEKTEEGKEIPNATGVISHCSHLISWGHKGIIIILVPFLGSSEKMVIDILVKSDQPVIFAVIWKTFPYVVSL